MFFILLIEDQPVFYSLAFSRTNFSNSLCSFIGSGGGPGLAKLESSFPSLRLVQVACIVLFEVVVIDRIEEVDATLRNEMAILFLVRFARLISVGFE